MDGISWDQLARFFAGELPAPEAERLRHWVEADPDRTALVARLREVWNEAAGLRQAWDAEAALHRIKHVPGGPVRVVPIPKFYREEPASPARRLARIGLGVAAALAILGAGAGILRLVLRRSPAVVEQPATVAEMATPRGQRAILRLPDGTKVMLGPASTLRYPSTYSTGPRTVRLEGEAYFEVVHDTSRPFTVRTARGIATDLGTRFGIRVYAGDSTLRVAVAEGLVSLAAARYPTAKPPSPDSLLLAAGDLGQVGPNAALAVRRGIDLRGYLAWTEGRLVFQDTPLREVAAQRARWYDLDVRIADAALGSRRLTASFANEPAPEVLRLVAASVGLRVDQKGPIVTLHAQR